MELGGDVDRVQVAGFAEIVGDLAVVHGLIHADIEGLLGRRGVVEGQEDRPDQVVDVDKVPVDGLALGITEDGDRSGPFVVGGLFRLDEIAPARAAEDLLGEGQGVAEIVLFHDPGGPEAAGVEVVLDTVLLDKDLLENLGESVAARVGRVPLLFGDRHGMGIEEVPHAGVSTEEDELLEGLGTPGLLEDPEEPLDRDIHDVLGGLLAGGQVEDVGDA